MKSTSRLVTPIVFVGILVVGALTGFATSVRPVLGLDLVGGLSVILSGPPGTEKAVMEQALETIRSRVDALGVAEPDISLLGSNLIQVQLPGAGKPGTVQQRGKLFCVLSSTGKDVGGFKNPSAAAAKA